jgi:hypothetical protein
MQGQTSSYVLTTLVTAPASANLTTLANIKDDMDLLSTDTSNDNRLTRYIAEESAAIARHCNRVFGLATWQDEFRPQLGVRGEGVRGANNPLKLTKWPLAAKVVLFTGNTHTTNIIDGLSTTAGLVLGQLVSGPGIPAGTTITTVNAGPANIVLSAPATATATAVPFSTGISVVETIASTDTGLTAGTDFEIDQGSLLPGDEGAGCIYRLNQQGNPRTWPAAKVMVVYQAGYQLPSDSSPNLPSDLQGVCLRVVVGRFRARGRDPKLVEQTQPNTIGTQRYWVGSQPGQTGPYPNEIMAILNNYRTPVVS